MSYIGNAPISAAFLTDTFSGDGSTVAFTMTVAPANTSSIIVAITGVLQDPSTYSVSGTTLTFSAAPPSGTSNISVGYLGIPASGVTTTAYRTVTEFTATAGQTSFSVPSYTVGYIDVYRNGVRLVSTDYTATTGTTVVLNNACTVGDSVVTESFLVSSVLNAIPNTGGSVSASNLAASGTASSSTFLRGDMAWLPVSYNADYVVVAGGGGGSQGGGGAGGMLGGTMPLNSGIVYNVTVGAGGAGTNGGGTNTGGSPGNNGSLSQFGSVVAGGGGGGGNNGGPGNSGGSGGGGGEDGTAGNMSLGGAGTGGQGNCGGHNSRNASSPFPGGGGGGAGAIGGFPPSNTVGGAGGAGLASSITGSSVTYAGGGGGGTASSGGTGGAGGSGGGGAGSSGGSGTAGTANTGGGGGGGGNSGGAIGGAGGSGVVIISVPTAKYTGTYTGTATVTTSGSNTIIKWTTGTGTYTA